MIIYLTNLCNSDVELRKCCGRCFGAVPALRRRESVGFAFLRSDERLDEVGGLLFTVYRASRSFNYQLLTIVSGLGLNLKPQYCRHRERLVGCQWSWCRLQRVARAKWQTSNFNDEILRCRENCITLLTDTASAKGQHQLKKRTIAPSATDRASFFRYNIIETLEKPERATPYFFLSNFSNLSRTESFFVIL